MPDYVDACPFCRVVRRESTAHIVFQDEQVTAFRDLHPRAPTHILIVPNRHVESLAALDDQNLGGHLLKVTRDIAQQLGADNGYRVVTNVGADAGQSVFHLHFHLLAGRKMGWPPG
jgi:histidine triad (HIT) family protein